MDRAPLRPVPGRPSGPVADAEAVRRVASALSGLDDRESAALALVAVAGRPRAEVGTRLGLDDEQLAAALARARKELRRTLAPLAGSGWCERAERLVSDRLDGALDDASASRLEVHLRNCERCVEHERRLVQATDALVTDVVPIPGRPELAPVPDPPTLTTVTPEPAEPDELSQFPWRVLVAVAILLAIAAIAVAVALAVSL
jgi:hypothetical protein